MSETLEEKIVKAAQDKKAADIVVLDMSTVTIIADYFIIMSAASSVQVQAIADNIEEKLEADGIKLLRKEGFREGRWVLMDYGAAIAHIFIDEDRRFYNLENLWGDAKRL